MIRQSIPVVEGAGVHLFRAIGAHSVDIKTFDPFLLLDNFHSRDPKDYLLGFPWHPHRGIETVTYMIEGEIEHQDSMQNKGIIKSGDVQWMTAGSGIIHQEMPKRYNGDFHGFQLWVNLPRKNKMMPPRYRGIESKDVKGTILEGNEIKVISGEYNGVVGAVKELVIYVTYLDVTMKEKLSYEIPKEESGFLYVYSGSGVFNGEKIEEKTIMNFDKLIATGNARFLLIHAKPLREPVAWRGPIVMNTEEELDTAFAEYIKGTFVK